MSKRFRVVRDSYSGFEVQRKTWFGLWAQIPTNTSRSLALALKRYVVGRNALWEGTPEDAAKWLKEHDSEEEA
jgi:hypothetical protein